LGDLAITGEEDRASCDWDQSALGCFTGRFVSLGAKVQIDGRVRWLFYAVKHFNPHSQHFVEDFLMGLHLKI
jgi:hypothetical protein